MHALARSGAADAAVSFDAGDAVAALDQRPWHFRLQYSGVVHRPALMLHPSGHARSCWACANELLTPNASEAANSKANSVAMRFPIVRMLYSSMR
jgi:hypothetical protein